MKLGSVSSFGIGTPLATNCAKFVKFFSYVWLHYRFLSFLECEVCF